jgi:hypothetical protein
MWILSLFGRCTEILMGCHCPYDILKREKGRKPFRHKESWALMHRNLSNLSLALMTCLNEKKTVFLPEPSVLGSNAPNSIGAVTDSNDMLKQEKDGNPAGTKSLGL